MKGQTGKNVCTHCGLPVAGSSGSVFSSNRNKGKLKGQNEPVSKGEEREKNRPEREKNRPDSTYAEKNPVFCCFGCRLVWEMEEHALPDTEIPGTGLSPLRKLYLRFALSLMISIFLVLISITLYFEGNQAPVFLKWLSLILATGVFFLLSGPFIENLKREIIEKKLSLATLIFTGSGAAYILSAWSLFSDAFFLNLLLTVSSAWMDKWPAFFSGYSRFYGVSAGGETYFETSAMILTFYVGSLLLDSRIKQQLAKSSRLWQIDRLPEVNKLAGVGETDYADLLGGSGRSGLRRVPADDLQAGDRFMAESRQPVLCDGKVLAGQGYVDESHLTGEPDLILKKAGDQVSAGSVSVDGGLILGVVHPYRESTLVAYLERARAMRSRPGYYERLAARGASWLLAIVVTVAFAGGFWTLTQHSSIKAVEVFLAVLLIGCPCAFALSIPSALWVAQQRLQRTGILAMGGSSALEKLSDTRVVMFDKTGTLTRGVAIRELVRETGDSRWTMMHIMQLAGGLEVDQEHPFARAVRRYLDQYELEPIRMKSAELLPGMGMRGFLEKTGEDGAEDEVLLVNNHHPAGADLQDDQFGLFLNGTCLARLSIYQPPRRHLESVITRLKKECGMRVVVVTGDSRDASEALPAKVLEGVEYHGGCSPEEKVRWVEHYKRLYGNVLYVGDGTNDLMAINRADLGVGVYTGTLSIRNSADFVLFHPNLLSISEMLSFSGKVRKTIRFNLFWAVIYNFVGIGWALMGWLHPFFAILAMMLSSLLVTFHAWLLQYRQPELNILEAEIHKQSGRLLHQAGIGGG